ncbi:acetyl-CoA carboxylase biotin carboxyl carrier protein [Pseudomonas gingeri]|uniref:Biotin carboxyl carrier protein of acetyl-CoA carboxylase n=1 Tax=Pseudomonas gingeri TaxID=117681 RepID=A0A7Y7XH60_9PSED|nr:biotin/lipoyl-containing protein [Pseudomonas gingeri]NWB99757.1 acetyl-CoA carboxylase biotin carboxyl carrier protein [Pseudomonas gingeri]
MDQQLFDQLVTLLQRSPSLTEIDHRQGDERIRLSKQAAPGSPVIRPELPVANEPAPVATLALPISSSLAGLFYRGPSPQEPAFVQVGDIVSEGQALGIVEAMKMLNLIEADRAGRITRICLDDGAEVKPGTLLFELQALGDTDV